MQGPRVAIVGVWLESNRQAPVAAARDFKSYYCLEGAVILDAARAANPLIMGEAAAFVQTMDATRLWTPVPILLAGCHPHGPVDGALMDRFLETIRTGLAEAGALDAVYIANHGAMLATNDEDPDGSVFALVRELIGPRTRIVVTLDLHGNISERMVSQLRPHRRVPDEPARGHDGEGRGGSTRVAPHTCGPGRPQIGFDPIADHTGADRTTDGRWSIRRPDRLWHASAGRAGG